MSDTHLHGPDGFGFHYGMSKDNGQVNVREEDGIWIVYLGGKRVHSCLRQKRAFKIGTNLLTMSTEEAGA